MKARGLRPDRRSDRRRKLAELNLLSEHKVKAAPSRSRRGCTLPFIGLGGTILGLAAVLAINRP
ncbi:MAG: hypothetical protein ACREOY_05180 [Candidatus Dormibacteraceae bacterium]